MEDCFDLKKKIEALIQRGRLRKFMASCLQSHSKTNEGPSSNRRLEPEVLREIKVIASEPVIGGESNSTRKVHL